MITHFQEIEQQEVSSRPLGDIDTTVIEQLAHLHMVFTATVLYQNGLKVSVIDVDGLTNMQQRPPFAVTQIRISPQH